MHKLIQLSLCLLLSASTQVLADTYDSSYDLKWDSARCHTADDPHQEWVQGKNKAQDSALNSDKVAPYSYEAPAIEDDKAQEKQNQLKAPYEYEVYPDGIRPYTDEPQIPRL